MSTSSSSLMVFGCYWLLPQLLLQLQFDSSTSYNTPPRSESCERKESAGALRKTDSMYSTGTYILYCIAAIPVLGTVRTVYHGIHMIEYINTLYIYICSFSRLVLYRYIPVRYCHYEYCNARESNGKQVSLKIQIPCITKVYILYVHTVPISTHTFTYYL